MKELISIANRVTASEESHVNCEEVVKAEEVGATIQKSLDDLEFLKDKVNTMAGLRSAVKIAGEEAPIDPILFSRLVALVVRENDLVLYFSYELSIYSALFKDGVMRVLFNQKCHAKLVARFCFQI